MSLTLVACTRAGIACACRLVQSRLIVCAGINRLLFLTLGGALAQLSGGRKLKMMKLIMTVLLCLPCQAPRMSSVLHGAWDPGKSSLEYVYFCDSSSPVYQVERV